MSYIYRCWRLEGVRLVHFWNTRPRKKLESRPLKISRTTVFKLSCRRNFNHFLCRGSTKWGLQRWYVGITDFSFKTMYNEHNSSFRLERSAKKTTLENLVHVKNSTRVPSSNGKYYKKEVRTRSKGVQLVTYKKSAHCQEHDQYYIA